MKRFGDPKKSNLRYYEHLLYGVLWGIVLLFPIVRTGGTAFDNGTIEWEYILSAWRGLIPFLILFLIHNLVLIPLLLFRRKNIHYLVGTLLLLGLFFLIVFKHHNRERERYKALNLHEQIAQDAPPGEPILDPMDSQSTHEELQPHFAHRIPGPVIMDTLIAFLMLGCNMAIRLTFRTFQEQRRMEELEKIHIRHELSQLRAQISPHFLMNSLNNIHGMVELNAQKAQEMILELSGMMRYILYESSPQRIALSQEIAFLKNYISLMSVRYSKKRVSIQFHTPSEEQAAKIFIPPLIFIIFIENAFKHGISYEGNSFIRIELTADERELHFSCVNSCPTESPADTHGGIGLKNIRKRLQILYGKKHSLTTERQESSYHVSLKLPTKDENQMYCSG